ncbi:PREDICTED: fibulin-5-like isoform X2 [Galeopterus variegatus]|uniref:Fibulin-5-like isoform X2 n=1 Tax=Galeopterus variegatus TaxID=482537 RepID=A0ABM0Q143_GALVR|nr:PREDICTED: fibulin-5-like isoform X2 [Galeopterus variegatus]
MGPRSFKPMKSEDCRQRYMIFTVTILALCLPSPGNAQPQCTNGFDLDRSSGQCLDIDECRTIPEACRGDMMSISSSCPTAISSQLRHDLEATHMPLWIPDG